MLFSKGHKDVLQFGLERRGCFLFLRQYGPHCNIGLEKDDQYHQYNSVESSALVATESPSYAPLCAEDETSLDWSLHPRRGDDRVTCNNSKLKDSEIDERKNKGNFVKPDSKVVQCLAFTAHKLYEAT
ncbi:hypothetical protein Ahia01_001034400 [Argonauta hians]